MNGAKRIAAERKRQIEEEGWTAEHDDDLWGRGQLADAAACYALSELAERRMWPHLDVTNEQFLEVVFPWSKRWYKKRKHDRIRQLEIAGALIAAEIDRLLRLER